MEDYFKKPSTINLKKLNTDDKDHFFAVTEAGDHQKIKEGPLELYKATIVEDNDLLLQSRTDPHWQILSKIIQKRIPLKILVQCS